MQKLSKAFLAGFNSRIKLAAETDTSTPSTGGNSNGNLTPFANTRHQLKNLGASALAASRNGRNVGKGNPVNVLSNSPTPVTEGTLQGTPWKSVIS